MNAMYIKQLKMRNEIRCSLVRYFMRTTRLKFTVTTKAVKAQTEEVHRSVL